MSGVTGSSLTSQAAQAYQQNRFSDAADLYQKAIAWFEDNRDEFQAAEMRNNLCVVYLQLGQPGKAISVVERTISVFKSKGDLLKQALAMGNYAAALDAASEYTHAIEWYYQSEQLLKSLGEKELRAKVLDSLSSLQLRSGKYLDALVTKKISLNLRSRLSLREKILLWLLAIPFKMIERK